MKVLGVDYGSMGALAFVDSETNEIKIFDMPMDDEGRVDVIEFNKILFGNKFDYVVIEDVNGSGPSQGKSSLLKQGKNIGMAEGCLIVHSELTYEHNKNFGVYDKFQPFNRVSAQRWERQFGLWGKGKQSSVGSALKIYPNAKDLLYGPRGGKKDGRSDALLIATYGIQKLFKKI